MSKYTTEQFWQLYKKIPQELRDALFAQETGENIYRACEQNGILGHLERVVGLTGDVLIGLLPAEHFSASLQKEIGLKKEVAEKVSQEINRFIFYPVKSAIEHLHEAPRRSTAPQSIVPEPGMERGTEEVESQQKRQVPDKYRESIE